MGNSASAQGPYADIDLPSLDQPLVVIDQRFVKPESTTIRLKETSSYSKNLSFKDVVSKKVLFHTGPEKQMEKLLDADKKPLVHISMKENIKNIYYVHRPDANKEKDAELLQIYVKQGLTTVKSYLETTLRVDFTDVTTGERCKIEIQGEWRARSALLWLQRGHDRPRTAVGKVYRTTMRDGFNVDIAPNVDTSLILLICAVVDDDLKRLRHFENGQGFWA